VEIAVEADENGFDDLRDRSGNYCQAGRTTV